MGFIEDILEVIPIPKMVKVEQKFNKEFCNDITASVREQLISLEGYKEIKPGQTIAITGGSRGITALAKITKAVVDMVKEKGAYPFIIPAMGSHGGATAEGQIRVLETNGITEKSMDCPIKSSMEVVDVGKISDGRSVFIDKYAHEADGIILVNRIKAHTSFKGSYESGLMKMMAIGLGKQHGAETYHKTGFGEMPKIVEEAGTKVLDLEKIIFGVASIENGYGEVAKIACLDNEEIKEKEKELLKYSYTTIARNFWKQVDVLIVTEMGKDITGTGLDPNVTGRFNTDFFSNDIKVSKIGILELTDKSQGNAAGVGFGDVITQRLYDKIDFQTMYPNVLTSTVIKTANIPMVLDNDKKVIQATIKTSNVLNHSDLRLSIIKNTKDLEKIYITENMVEEAINKGCRVLSEPMDINFDLRGNLNIEF